MTDRLPPALALVLFPISMSLMVVFAGPAERAFGLLGLALAEWALVAWPTFFAAGSTGRPATRVLGLTWPPGLAIAGALLAGAAAWALLAHVVVPVQEHFAPTPKELEESLSQLAYGPPPALALFALALTPAVCEELLCRGALTRALAPATGAAGAVLASAALFGLLHLSVYRFAPTFLLGVVLGAATLASGSVVPAILIHLVNNSVVVLLPPGQPATAWVSAHGVVITVAAAPALALGLWLCRRPPASSGRCYRAPQPPDRRAP